MGYSRGGLVEPVCGKRGTMVAFSGAPVMTGLPAARLLIGSAPHPSVKPSIWPLSWVPSSRRPREVTA